jgi:hypothetical protein
VVEVEQGGLGALEDHRLVAVERFPAEPRRVGDVRLQAVPVADVLLGHRVQVEARVGGVADRLPGGLAVALSRLLAQLAALHREFAQRLLLAGQRRADLRPQDLLVEQVLDADPEPQGLVGVAGADAAARGAQRELAQLQLSGRVEQHVVGHDQVGIGGDLQVADIDPAPTQPVDLAEQDARVEHHPVADCAGLLGIEDPRGDQVELELLAVADDRVPGVVAALKAHDHLGALGKQVGDLALALVAPLRADYR